MPRQSQPRTTSDASPRRRKAAGSGRFVFCLCVTGMTPRSRAAISNLRTLCECHLRGRYALEVIDLYQRPELARQHHILATPTVIRTKPLPRCRVLGSLTNGEHALRCLGIALSD